MFILFYYVKLSIFACYSGRLRVYVRIFTPLTRRITCLQCSALLSSISVDYFFFVNERIQQQLQKNTSRCEATTWGAYAKGSNSTAMKNITAIFYQTFQFILFIRLVKPIWVKKNRLEV